MNIMDLDEAEGLTAEMVRGYLERNGWTKATLEDIDPSRWSKADLTVWLPTESEELSVTIQGLRRVEKRSVQSILREMNPRMRKGLPTEAEREVHGFGRWIASRKGDEYRHTTIVRILCGVQGQAIMQFEDHRASGSFDASGEWDRWSFWPCDAHGNKVPLPKVPA